MTALHRVLAATDLSAPARHAVERAALVCKVSGASLALLHVAELAPMEKLRRLMSFPDDLEPRLHDNASDTLLALAESIRQHHAINTSTQLACGAVLTELTRQINAIGADLTVVGARGASFLRHLMLGSTAERMLGRAKSPLLVVKQAAHEPYRSLLVPVDFSAASLPALRHARAVAPDAHIVLLHAYDVPFEGFMSENVIHQYRSAAELQARQQQRDLIAQSGLKPAQVSAVVLHGEPVLRIIEQEQVHDCDLIVMGKHGEHKIEELFLGSATRRVLAESQADVLVSV